MAQKNYNSMRKKLEELIEADAKIHQESLIKASKAYQDMLDVSKDYLHKNNFWYRKAMDLEFFNKKKEHEIFTKGINSTLKVVWKNGKNNYVPLNESLTFRCPVPDYLKE